MSMWWAQKSQLDQYQVELIEDLDLNQSYVVLGPPGSGKTNVLLRRAQFTRGQGMPNVLVLTFTRSLTEFLKTGCRNSSGSEIFPPNCIMTYEGWIRGLFKAHNTPLPPANADFVENKRQLANTAITFLSGEKLPKYDALFVDEAQDLTTEEVRLIRGWADVVFFVGDDSQRIYEHGEGLTAIRGSVPKPIEKSLPFHYRLSKEICDMAGKIRVGGAGRTLAETSHYDGPKPGRITVHKEETREGELAALVAVLSDQLRAYGDLIAEGEKLGIVVRRREDREAVLQALEEQEDLEGLSQIVRARSGDQDDKHYDPTLDPARPILILSEHGCKGLEFRALHWLFVDENNHYRTDEQTYTVITRAKTSIDIYHRSSLPQSLARAYAEKKTDLWES